MERKKVHVIHTANGKCFKDGDVAFNLLYDDGSNVMRFDGPYGLIDKHDIKTGYEIKEGWAPLI